MKKVVSLAQRLDRLVYDKPQVQKRLAQVKKSADEVTKLLDQQKKKKASQENQIERKR